MDNGDLFGNIVVNVNENHSYDDGVVTEATCTVDGKITYTCSRCNYSYDEVTEIADHDYKETVTTNPTCTTNGKTTYVCSKCNESYSETIEKLGHDYVKTVVKPTCAAKGYTLKKCSRCKDEITSNYVSATGNHHYEESIIAPTCAEKGYTYKKCSVCGKETKSNYVSATGNHDYEETAITIYPTCTDDGERILKCKNCGESKTEKITRFGHDYVYSSTVQATCTQVGYAIHVCSRCWVTKNSDYTNRVAHQYGEVTTVNPTAVSDGKTSKTCQVCGYVEENIIAKLESSVTLTKKKLSLKTGKTKALKIKKKTNGDSILKWQTSNKKIVTVNKKTGEIKAIKKGKATITITMKSGCSTTCEVIVK
jgi:hypothetical protein